MIKVGDKVKTSKDYERTLTTCKPCKGVVIEILNEHGGIATIKIGNNHLRYVNVAWLVKDK